MVAVEGEGSLHDSTMTQLHQADDKCRRMWRPSWPQLPSSSLCIGNKDHEGCRSVDSVWRAFGYSLGCHALCVCVCVFCCEHFGLTFCLPLPSTRVNRASKKYGTDMGRGAPKFLRNVGKYLTENSKFTDTLVRTSNFTTFDTCPGLLAYETVQISYTVVRYMRWNS
jgi:hypothetical protein